MGPVLVSPFHFLFAFLFSTTIAQNVSTITACCASTESHLNSVVAKYPNCSLAASNDIIQKCLSCPAGTCRLDNRCICPDFFISASSHRSQCANAFGVNWPTSIGKEDRDYRSCDPTNKPPPANATSCCAMSESELQALRGHHSDCPSISHKFQLTKKCDRCPPGLCRLDDECICPDRFLDITRSHKDCAASFTAAWPVSIGKEDRATRSCRGASPVKSTILSCCSLTEEKLNDMIGTSDRCPSSPPVLLSDECSLCPSGMCRFRRLCYCPTRFLTGIVKDTCERTFDVAWPESIGKKDPDITDCNNGTPTTVSPTTTSAKTASGTSEESSNSPAPSDDLSTTETQEPNNSKGASTPTESSSGADGTTSVNPEQQLTTLEIVGIVAGVVSAVVAVVVAAIGLVRHRKKRHHEEPSLDEFIR